MDAKSAILGSYLQQQSRAPHPLMQPQQQNHGGEAALVIHQAVAPSSANGSTGTPSIDSMTLDDFKEYVRRYIEIDSWIQKAQEVMREKKKQRDKLSEIITKFMLKYDIEDLKVKQSKLRCTVRQVKQPITQKVIKEKISDYFKGNDTKTTEIIQKVFEEDRPVKERATLRRLKIT